MNEWTAVFLYDYTINNTSNSIHLYGYVREAGTE
jgi:hypothetical protein